jgi:hypothetical protein
MIARARSLSLQSLYPKFLHFAEHDCEARGRFDFWPRGMASSFDRADGVRFALESRHREDHTVGRRCANNGHAAKQKPRRIGRGFVV